MRFLAHFAATAGAASSAEGLISSRLAFQLRPCALRQVHQHTGHRWPAPVLVGPGDGHAAQQGQRGLRDLDRRCHHLAAEPGRTGAAAVGSVGRKPALPNYRPDVASASLGGSLGGVSPSYSTNLQPRLRLFAKRFLSRHR